MLPPVIPVNETKFKEENDQPLSIHTMSQQFHGIQYQSISLDHYQIHMDMTLSSRLLTNSRNTLSSFPPTSLSTPKDSPNSSAITSSVASAYPSESSLIKNHNLSPNSSQIFTSHSVSQVSRPQLTTLKEMVKLNE